ncbi:MAG: hypothetical protein DWQ35_08335 [Planctomycetota bacterium]|nr:MAG: hypothetical protein DWQ35_08335 [Planctomycetota bacterium]REK22071.1 MAG: hypothetical protein DWQ42_18190 [Planctomycetota bacterium]REK44479.1 MAG: hypothetical protein DWQ46_09475 [Planctomycetota bacterium]
MEREVRTTSYHFSRVSRRIDFKSRTCVSDLVVATCRRSATALSTTALSTRRPRSVTAKFVAMSQEAKQNESDNDARSVAKRHASAWMREHRLKTTAAVTTALFGSLALIQFSTAPPAPVVETEQDILTLQSALEALDADDYREARKISEELRFARGAAQLGGPAFVLGASAAYEADTLWGKERLTYYVLASTYLREAYDRGFPPSRDAEGLFLLGKSLYLSNRPTASRPILAEALQLDPASFRESDRLEALLLATEANLGGSEPRPRVALTYNADYLESDRLSRRERDEGLLRHARILYELGEAENCRQYLNKLSSGAHNRAAEKVLRGRLLISDAEQLAASGPVDQQQRTQIEQLYDNALEVLEEVHELDASDDLSRGQAHYLMGVSYRALGKQSDAINEFRKVRNRNLVSGEGIVAALNEAELLRELGQDDEAIQRYRDTVRAITSAGTPHNVWMDGDELRQHLLDSVAGYIGDEKFSHAVQLAEVLAPLVRPTQSVLLTAQSEVAWANTLQARAETLSGTPRQETLKEARQHYRQAGRTYARLARLRFATREYPDDLWASADNFRKGHDFSNAIAAFQDYLRNDTRRRIPAALVGLGEAHLAQGDLDKAIDAFMTCIEEHATDPANFRARFLVAEAHMENGDLKTAEKFLRGNLTDPQLGPKSREWENSKFSLGRLLQADGRYEEAIAELDEAVARYPNSPHAMEARYLMAESYRYAARRPLDQLRSTNIEAHKQQLIEESKALLAKAEDHYQKVRQELNLRPESAVLTPLESAILRNCYFALAAVYFDQGEFDSAFYTQAREAYGDVVNLYQNEPAAVEARIMLAACQRRLGQSMKAYQTLKQAQSTFERLDKNLDFERTTSRSHAQWKRHLENLLQLTQ